MERERPDEGIDRAQTMGYLRALVSDLWPTGLVARRDPLRDGPRAFASHLVAHHQGMLEHLLALPLHRLRQELLGIYGIGEETADSIILYGSEQPIFVVDAYTRRIYQRLGFFPDKISYGCAV